MPKTKEPIISVTHLYKSYPLYKKKQDRIIELFDPLKRQKHTCFNAIHDVSFSINKNECIGIVGINGSGKSTLLKILTGVLTPTSGSVIVKGKVSALLELGAGFHPERTGLENIYFQGALQGQTQKEVDTYLEDIMSFADIGEYIHQPVKLYSSGMFVRLAFATAIQGHPDILIVDEALAVGDVCFQRRCFQRIEELKQQGVTFIFVSHASEQIVTHCSRALLLSKGQLIMDEKPRIVVNRYMDILFGREHPDIMCTSEYTPTNAHQTTTSNQSIEDSKLTDFIQSTATEDQYASHPWYNPYEYRWGDGRAKILDIYITSSNDINTISPGDYLAMYIKVLFLSVVFRPIFGCTIKTREGITVYGSNTEINGSDILYQNVNTGFMTTVKFTIQCNLAPGEYFLSFGIAVMEKENIPLDRRYDSLLLTIHGPANFFGISDLAMTINNIDTSHA